MKKIFSIDGLFFYGTCLAVILFPAALIAGPFPAEVLMNFSSIIILYLILKEKKYHYFKNKVSYIFFTFCLYLIIRSFFSVDKLLSFEASLFYFRYGLFVIAILYILDSEKRFLNFFLFALVITFIILIFDGYYQFITGENTLGFKSQREDRLGGLFFDELILGSFIVKLFPLFCISYFYLENKILKYIIIFLLLTAYLLVFFSGERASFILINIFVFISCAAIFKTKYFLFFSTIIFISLLSIVYNNEKIKDRYYHQFLIHLFYKTIEVPPSTYKKIVFFPEHAIYFKISQNMFLDNVFFGQGPKTFRALCFKKKFRNNLNQVSRKTILSTDNYVGCTTHTHNYYLQILSETGLVGFSFVFYFFIILLKKLFTSYKYKNKINILICTGLITNLWPLTTTGNFFNNWISMTIYLLIPIFLYYNKNDSFQKN